MIGSSSANGGTKPRGYSIYRRISLSLIIVYVVMFGLMLANSLYSIHVIRQKLYDQLYDTLRLQNDQIEQGLLKAQFYLAAQLPATANLPTVMRDQRDSEYYLALHRLKTDMNNTLSTLPYVRGVFVLPLTSKLFIPASDDAAIAVAVRDFIKDMYGQDRMEECRERGWFPLELNGEHYLIRILKVNNSYMGVWTDFSKILPDVKNQQTLEQTALFLSGDGAAYDESSKLTQLEPPETDGSRQYTVVRLDEPYMMITTGVGYMAGGRVALLVPDRQIRTELTQNYLLMLVFGLVALALALAVMFVLRRYLQKPIAHLKGSIDDLRGGNFSAQVSEDEACVEFAEVNSAFNDMVNRIEDLKINVYEERLVQQRLEIRYLKNQIAPHFLINCLNAVYHMAVAGDIGSVKKMTIYLGNHLRYTLSEMHYVPLGTELREVANYVELSCLRFPDGVKLCLDIDPAIEDAMILPMMLLTFVENTVKHEVVSGYQMEIHVEARFADESQTRANLSLWDTGGGWSDELLEMLNSGEMLKRTDGYQLGLRNLQQRITLDFGGDFSVRYSNHPGAGAQVDFEFPYMTGDNAEQGGKLL